MRIAGDSPEIFGAIFMANHRTMDECLSRNLFGLPSSQSGFVSGLKIGDFLFLFQFEDRTLHGVFRAISDGAMDIVPEAFANSRHRFPAQVRFETVWNCEPLRERDFRDAIRENYYQRSKFHFGLSEYQVRKLLWLFDSRRTKDNTSRDFLSVRSRNKEQEKERLGFQRKLSFGKSIITFEQSETSLSYKTLEDNSRSSRYSESGNSIRSFECESSINAIGDRKGEIVVEQGLESLEKLEDPSKLVSSDLEDFIPLPASPDSDDNEDSPGNDQMTYIPFECCIPLRLINSEPTKNEGIQDSSQHYNNQKLSVLDNKKAGHLCIKGLYSDEEGRSSVFSRLNFDLNDKRQGKDYGSTKENKPAQKREGDSKMMFGYKKKSVFSRIPQNIVDQHRNRMEKSEFCSSDGEEDIESIQMRRDEKKIVVKSNTNARYDDFKPVDVKMGANKNVFSRLSWASFYDNQAQGYNKVREARISGQEKSGNQRRNELSGQWSETLHWKRTRDFEVENYAHISHMMKSQSDTDHGNDFSEDEWKFREQPRQELMRPYFDQTSKDMTSNFESRGTFSDDW